MLKNKTRVACRMSGIERRVVHFGKLPFEMNGEKFSLGRVKSKKNCRRLRKSVAEESGMAILKSKLREWNELNQ